MEFPFDPEIPPLGIYPEDPETPIQKKNMHPCVFLSFYHPIDVETL